MHARGGPIMQITERKRNIGRMECPIIWKAGFVNRHMRKLVQINLAWHCTWTSCTDWWRQKKGDEVPVAMPLLPQNLHAAAGQSVFLLYRHILHEQFV